MNGTFALEWSKSSNGFHINEVSYLLPANRRLFELNKSHDYIILMIGTKDECTAAADVLRPTLIKRAAL